MISQRIRSTTRLTLSALALAALLPAADAGAEIIRKDDMLRGVTTTRAQCAAIAQAVWLTVYGKDYCVRYYVSTAGGEGHRPVVFLQGDYFGNLDPKSRTWKSPVEAADLDTANLQRMADALSRRSKTTAIYLGRIGVEGTSGNHTSRKTVLELNLMNRALDAIKQRHGFAGFHMVGQSGGSKLVGGLVGLRNDVACAVVGSGPMTAPGSPPRTDPTEAFFNVIESIPAFARNPSLRLMVVSDPADKIVPIAMQTGFVDKMRQAGRPVPQFLVEATDNNHHGVVAYAHLVAAGCVLGKSDAEIARAASTMTARAAEINQQKINEARARASIVSRHHQPGSTPASTNPTNTSRGGRAATPRTGA
jgi:hypothetical protein